MKFLLLRLLQAHVVTMLNKYSFFNPCHFVILIIVVTACQTTSVEDELVVEDELDYAQGEVLISVENDVEESEIKSRIEELNLEWKKFYEHLGGALIGVPIGEEEIWVEKLKKEPLIRNAQLNRKIELR